VWLAGFTSAEHMGYDGEGSESGVGGFVQTGLAPSDFENGIPLYDAFFLASPLFLEEPRRLEIRFGQFFVPFGRMRSLAENQYQVIRRAPAIDALAPARDVGFEIDYRNEHFFFRAGLFAGEGRNRIETERSGVMTTLRLVVEPFDAIDTRDEATSAKLHEEPALSVGASVAYNRRTSRSQGIDATSFELGTTDEAHLGLDALVRYRGFSASTELVYRRARLGRRDGVDADGNAVTDFGRHGLGYVVQASYRLPIDYDCFEMWARFSHLITYRGTDPALEAVARARGKDLAYGTNLYLTEDHHLKLQIEVSHQFVSRGRDTDQFIVALDGTFDVGMSE
jgi:hypothetical protein